MKVDRLAAACAIALLAVAQPHEAEAQFTGKIAQTRDEAAESPILRLQSQRDNMQPAPEVRMVPPPAGRTPSVEQLRSRLMADPQGQIKVRAVQEAVREGRLRVTDPRTHGFPWKLNPENGWHFLQATAESTV